MLCALMVEAALHESRLRHRHTIGIEIEIMFGSDRAFAILDETDAQTCLAIYMPSWSDKVICHSILRGCDAV